MTDTPALTELGDTETLADPSIMLTRLEVENFRAIGNAVLEPLTDGGMTAINGSNGAGKSSLLIALCWCLYGVTPDGVTGRNLRRQGSEGDPCRVQVDFSHHGQNITIERGMKGTKDTPYARVSIDGVEQTFGKVSAASAWIINRLGPKETFLTAFVIRQKELDQLVKSEPSKRRALIERLAGIDRMSEAVKTARAEENDAKKALQYLPGSPEEVQAAAAEMAQCEKAKTDSERTCEIAQERVEYAQQEYATLKEEYTKLRQTAHELDQLHNEKTQLEAFVREITQEIGFKNQRLQQLDTQLENASYSNENQLQQQLNSLNQQLEDARESYTQRSRETNTLQQLQQHAQQLQHTLQQLTTEKTNLETTIQQLDEPNVVKKLATLTKIATKLRDDINEQTSIILTSDNKLTELETSRNLLQAATTPTCPTCTTPLPDITHVMGLLNDAHKQAEKTKTAAARKQHTLNSKLETTISDIETRQTTLQHCRDLTHKHTTLTAKTEETLASINDTNTRLQETQTNIDMLNQKFSQYNPDSIKENITRTQQQLFEAKTVGDARREHENLTANIGELNDRAQKHAEAITRVTEATTRLTFDPTVVPQLETRMEQLRDDIQTNTMEHNNARNTYENASQNLIRATRDHTEAQRRIKIREEALKDYEDKTAVTEALDVFRKDRISRFAPELSEISTELIVKMTDGKFTAIELTEDFTPIVTDTEGNTRPVTWLSGGEESNVALALRLAIGEIVSGSQGGLLWMDEPQAAMDAERRPSMMAAIREMQGRQPIIISHASEASDMVDMVFDVIPDSEHGSTIVAASNSGEHLTNIV